VNPQLTPYARFEHGVRRYASTWLFRLRGPEPGEVFLTQRRVFIIPSHPGLLFCLMLAALLVGSINYNLSLGFGLTFLLAACGLIDMLLTFRNLAHLHLSAGRAAPVFAGEEAQFELQLTNRSRRDRFAIWLDFVHDDRAPDQAQATDVAGNANSTVLLATPTTERGWLHAPRVRLQTRFPLGLLRAWAYWQPDTKVLVYPRPEDNGPPLPLAGLDENDEGRQAGHDDFAGIRAYQAGDSPRRLAWRQIARLDPALGVNLITKQFEGGGSGETVLDLALLPNRLGLEAALSRLTRWAIEAEARGLPYALRLGTVNLPAALGPAHRAACLRALALHQDAA
jgi:uncharacterized protein (DUF58 family)